MILVHVAVVRNIRNVAEKQYKYPGGHVPPVYFFEEIIFLMSNFTDEQLEAITWFKGPMLILGTPGSGKTTVIVNRINNLIYEHNVNPSNILVITFTRAAAESMKKRFLDMTALETTEVRFGTFHSFFYWIIRTAYRNMNFNVMDENDKRNKIRALLCEIDKEMYDSDEMVTSVLNQLGRLSCDMIDIDDYYSTDMPEQDFRNLYKKFTRYKLENSLLDFDDMVTRCYELLSERKDILEHIRNMYPYIMVDEFQDTNKIQYEILKLLAHPKDNLYVVGDDDQSIYGFRGARPDIMLSFGKEFPDTKTLRLSINHRCPAEIVDVSSKLIVNNKKRYDKSLRSAAAHSGHFEISRTKDIREENELVCRRINNAIKKGISPDEIAVLYRTNLSPRRLMYKLREYNIDFNIRDNVPDIFSHPIVVPIINYISYALGNHRRDIFLSFMNKPVRYISRQMLVDEVVERENLLQAAEGKRYLIDNIKRLYSELRTISCLNPYSAINYIREAIGYNKYLKTEAENRNSDYDEIMDLLDEFQSMTKDIGTFGDFYDMIEDYRNMINEQNEKVPKLNSEKNLVQLMTLHSAKGLEFKNVHIIDVTEGNIPHKKSRSPSEMEEERRMFYVGMTRSSDELYIYVPASSGDKQNKESRFIREVNDDN